MTTISKNVKNTEYPLGKCPRNECLGMLYAQPSDDGSCYQNDACDRCGATWWNDPPLPWPPALEIDLEK